MPKPGATGLTANIRLRHLLDLADQLGITRPRQVIEPVRSAVAAWPTTAAESDVPADVVRRIGSELDARRREL